jgi:Concanavalin A-like lectin/glucanases superfamily/Secretion system C-terminal sorting domain
MNRILLYSALIFLSLPVFSQSGQLSISRINEMPDLPAPLMIRNWHAVALNYDTLVFNTGKTGQYMPFASIGTAGEFNYPNIKPLFLDSYVGAGDHSNEAEAINILPAIVGASLAGIDKSKQNGMNWVYMSKDFFNLANGQDVYLNNYSTSSGSDWWYDVMPNVYFYQIQSLYPDTSVEFHPQFASVADRWLNCIYQLGGKTTPWSLPNMNYRAFNLATGIPLSTGVIEPEAAGSIAWLLYNAYLKTGNRKYLEGAQLAMDFLAKLTSNPSYEIQLPYGTLAASRMNAVEGTNYPLQQMLNWCFDHNNPLRGWGVTVGTWGGYDASGLIGEATDGGNDYAFVMNGFQQAAALAPLPKYDKRFALAIAKWLLNVTNASRLFYWNALPPNQQDSYGWASVNDPTACIPHESMKQTLLAESPYATGDAIGGGWAATNLSLYSGSSVGYLSAVIDTTNVPGILRINLNNTDFYGENTLLSYLYFNPATTSKQVNLNLPAGTFGVYDALTESILNSNVSGSFQFPIPAGEARLIRLYTAGILPQANNGKLYAGTDILDYHYQYNYSQKLRIKALSVIQNPLVINSVFTAYCDTGNIIQGQPVQFKWYLNDSLINGQNQLQAQFTAPDTACELILKCIISSNGQTAQDTLHIHVVGHIATPPVVNGIQSLQKYTAVGGENTFTVNSSPGPGEILQYRWSASAGNLLQTSGSSVSWQAPGAPTVATITVKAVNQDTLSTVVSVGALVKDTNLASQTPLIWYPFDTGTLNAVSDSFNATASGVTKTADARGIASLAYHFATGQDIIYTPNQASLNFSNAVSLSFWVKCESFGSERFIISHGSWQQRYKLSIIPTGFLRWTVKTDSGVCDLDGSAPIALNQYYHVTAVYTGYSMELYVNGMLDTFKPFSGTILSSTKPITLGREDDVETLYDLIGSVDEVKIWNKEIPVSQIAQLKNEWATPAGIINNEVISRIYPNPVRDVIYIDLIENASAEHVSLFSIDGTEEQNSVIDLKSNPVKIEIPQAQAGVYILRIKMKDGSLIIKKIIIL